MTKMATSDRPHGTVLLLIWIAFGIYSVQTKVETNNIRATGDNEDGIVI